MGKYTEIERTITPMDDEGFLTREEVNVKMYLKKCPCCGGPGKTEHLFTNDGRDLIFVRCAKCGLQIAPKKTHDEAAEAWNMRRISAAIKPKKIRDCPFCSGKGETEFSDDEENPDGIYVTCAKCEARIPVQKDAGTAIRTWNRRA